MKELWKLREPFRAKDIEWRVQQAGTKDNKVWAKVLAYVTNRAIMERLDEVCSPAGWRNEYKEWIGGSVLCGLSINIDGEWITKWDGSEQTDIEATKGGLSGAMKRAAVQWGIGRYLYNLDTGFAKIVEKGGEYYQAGKKDSYPAFYWNPPDLPAWALPADEKKKTEEKTETKSKEEPEQSAYGFDNDPILIKIEECNDNRSLKKFWDTLSGDNKELYKSAFTARRAEIEGGI